MPLQVLAQQQPYELKVQAHEPSSDDLKQLVATDESALQDQLEARTAKLNHTRRTTMVGHVVVAPQCCYALAATVPIVFCATGVRSLLCIHVKTLCRLAAL